MFGDMLTEREILEEDPKLEELFSNGSKVQNLKWQRDEVLSKYFTRDKISAMLKFITEMPDEDATRERQHSIPFFCDMFFKYNHKVINEMFFASELQDENEKDKKLKTMSSDLEMVDVLIAPQSDEADDQEDMKDNSLKCNDEVMNNDQHCVSMNVEDDQKADQKQDEDKEDEEDKENKVKDDGIDDAYLRVS